MSIITAPISTHFLVLMVLGAVLRASGCVHFAGLKGEHPSEAPSFSRVDGDPSRRVPDPTVSTTTVNTKVVYLLISAAYLVSEVLYIILYV